jgi:hypothetical protein
MLALPYVGGCAVGFLCWIGLARAVYIRCLYSVFGREVTICTVVSNVYITCMYSVFGREVTKCTVVYNVNTRF